MIRRAFTLTLTLLAAAGCQGTSTHSPAQPTSAVLSPSPTATPSEKVPPSPGASSSTSAAPAAPSAGPLSRCRTQQLAVRFAGSQGAAGTIFLTFRLSNTGSTECSLRGFVGLQMLDAADHPLPTRAVRSGGIFSNQPPASSFTLQPPGAGPAAAATFQVAYSTVPRAGETDCPQAYGLVVTPPDEFDHLVIPVQGWSLAPCNRGELDLTPLRPPGVAPR
jgi:hypothetical protein